MKLFDTSTLVDVYVSSLTRSRLRESSLLYNSRYSCQFIDLSMGIAPNIVISTLVDILSVY